MDRISSEASGQPPSELAEVAIQLSVEADGTVLSAAAHLPDDLPAPVVVCSHGFLSAKESPKFIAVCRALSRVGFCALRFDFSGCGQSPPRSGPGLVEARTRDLEAAIAFVLKQPWSDGRLGLFGSSLGGFLSLLAANKRPELVLAAVSWAAPFEMGSRRPEEMVSLSHDGLRAPGSLAGLEDAGRVLLIHGQSDEVVGWRDSVRIYKRLRDPKKLLLMRGADHRFSDVSWRDTAIRQTVEWFRAHLK